MNALDLRPSIAVEEVSGRAGFRALHSEWERLLKLVADRRGTSGPFLSCEWFAILASTFTEAKHLKILVAHRAGQVIGLLPLVWERRSLNGLSVRVLRSLSDDHSQRFDVLCAEQAAADALFGHLAGLSMWDVIELRDVPEEGAERNTGASLFCAAAKAAGYLTGRWPSLTSPFLPLTGETAPSEVQLRTKFRANLRRRARKLTKELGPLSLEHITGAGGSHEIDQALEDGLRLEAKGWKGRAGTAISCDPLLKRRYRAWAHAFSARGELSLYFLRVGGARRAFHFALEQRGVYYLFKPGFDPELSSFGLGHLLIDQVVGDLTRRGIRELDFLGDDMPWKREWTSLHRPHSWRYVFRPNILGRALHLWKFRLIPQARALFGGR